METQKIEDDNLLELYYQGLTNREIADKLQVTQAGVYYRLQRLGLVNNCHKVQDTNPEKIERLHKMGLTSLGIAFLLQTNVLTISQCMKELGLKDNYYRLKEIVNQQLEVGNK
jgi:orotate phosphoribosyltransferase-like protein